MAGFGISTSSDGINWTLYESDNIAFRGINYIDKVDLFFTYKLYNDSFIIKTSSDGANWQDTVVNTKAFEDLIFYDKGGFFINNQLYVSNDGLKYMSSKRVTGINYIGQFNKIVYSKKMNKFLVIGINTGYVFTSSDGINWLQSTVLENRVLNCAIYVDEWEKFFVAGDSNNIFNSNDGINWNGAIIPDTYSPVISMIYSKKQNKLIASNYGNIYASSNGINWEILSQQFIAVLAYSEKLNLYIGFESGSIFYYSTSSDGINWETYEFNLSNSFNITNAIFAEELGLFIVLCQGGVLTSPDGINWEEHTLENVILSDVIYSEELCMLIACGTHNKKGCIAVSYDGKTWNVEDLQTDSGLMSISENTKNINFCIVGTEAKILNSIKVEGENIINDLSNDSDLSLSLESGENELLLTCEEGNVNGVISYRQKYIGV